MILFVKFLIPLFFLSHFVFSEEILKCNTNSNIGLNFLGKDYEKILDYLHLKKFKIKLSRNRSDIILQEKNKLKKNHSPKTSHFFEIVIIKSSGYPIPMHCSWVHDLRNSKIEDNDFNCIGVPENDKVLSLDFNGNFMYSSKFEEFAKNGRNNKTLHSLIGKCK